jgi:hypothetical protein
VIRSRSTMVHSHVSVGYLSVKNRPYTVYVGPHVCLDLSREEAEQLWRRLGETLKK